MILAIQDAKILIDLHKAGLLEAYFRLGIETHTTDLVLLEVRPSVAVFVLTRDPGRFLVKTGCELSGKRESVADSQPRDRRPSLRDTALRKELHHYLGGILKCGIDCREGGQTLAPAL